MAERIVDKLVWEAVKYCERHGILRGFLEIHGSEEKLEIARNLKAAGVSADIILQATGLNEVSLNLGR